MADDNFCEHTHLLSVFLIAKWNSIKKLLQEFLQLWINISYSNSYSTKLKEQKEQTQKNRKIITPWIYILREHCTTHSTTNKAFSRLSKFLIQFQFFFLNWSNTKAWATLLQCLLLKLKRHASKLTLTLEWRNSP